MKRLATFIFVLAVIAASLSIPALSQNAQKKQQGAATSQQKPEPDIRGTDKAPVIVKMLPTETANEKAAKEQKEADEKDEERRWNRTLAIATIVLSALTLIALVLQLGIMRKQNIIQKGMLQTTNEQREINARQVSHFERKERAWLHPENFSIAIERDPAAGKNKAFYFTLLWKNGGNSTALNVSMNAVGEAFVGDIPAGFDFESRYTGTPKPTYVGPNGSASSVTVRVDVADVQAALDQHITYFIWGRVTYEDIFIGTETRETKFCWQLSGCAGDPYFDVNVTFQFSHDPRYSSIS